jgi:purine-binding chemotaxis protein CheW
VVVVVNVRGRVVGAVVDSVSDVLALEQDQIKPAPEMNSTVEASHIEPHRLSRRPVGLSQTGMV